MSEQQPNGEVLAFVAASDYRRDVVRTLWAGGETPSGIAEAVDAETSHISRALEELRYVGVVELLVPEDTKRGRVFGLTDAGRELSEVLR
jgi:DNA-binding MarR family transcriptional regulator